MATAKELILQMPSVFQADKAGDMNAVVQFDLAGDGGGQWHVTVASGQCQVAEGAATAPTATIKMSADDYARMVTGELNAVTAFMMGQIRVEGDLNTVMKFQTLFG